MMVQTILMGRFTRLRPVNSIKHVVDKQGGLVLNVKTDETLILSVDAPTVANTPQVVTGSTVGSIFLNVQVAASSTAALANVYMYVLKNPGGNLTEVNANVVGGSDIKKFVIHQEMIMTEKNTTAIPRTLFKGVIRIPPRMKRFGTNDSLILSLFAPGVNFDYCVQCIYKEFR